MEILPNQIALNIKGSTMLHDLPAFGETKIITVAGEVKFIETTTKEKID
jgi:hypothetical protein